MRILVGADCGVFDWGKHDTLKLFGHIVTANEDEFIKEVNKGKVEWYWRKSSVKWRSGDSKF